MGTQSYRSESEKWNSKEKKVSHENEDLAGSLFQTSNNIGDILRWNRRPCSKHQGSAVISCQIQKSPYRGQLGLRAGWSDATHSSSDTKLVPGSFSGILGLTPGPQNSPDLNPLDFCLWDELAQAIEWDKVACKKTLIDSCDSRIARLSRMAKSDEDFFQWTINGSFSRDERRIFFKQRSGLYSFLNRRYR